MEVRAPKALADPGRLEARLQDLNSAHVADLNNWVRSQNAKRRQQMPWFDPGDAGVAARVLFLLESPGPMANADKGSSVVSIDNNDDTAKNLWGFSLDPPMSGGV
jgi:hypothetical protein